MDLRPEVTVKQLRQFLKREFSLDVRITRNGRPVADLAIVIPSTGDKKMSRKYSFLIETNTVISDLILFCSQKAGLDMELRNKAGIKMSGELTLMEARDAAASPLSSSLTVDSNIHAALSIARESKYYSDADWVRRVFENAAYKVKSLHERCMLINAAVSLSGKEPSFPSRQVGAILSILCEDKGDYAEAYSTAAGSEDENVRSLTKEIRRIANGSLAAEELETFIQVAEKVDQELFRSEQTRSNYSERGEDRSNWEESH